MKKMSFPTSIFEDMAKADLFSIFIPEEYGGLGGGCFEIVLALEELSRGCVGVATSFAASALGIFPVLIAGSDEMKEKYLPEIASWKKMGSIRPDRIKCRQRCVRCPDNSCA